MFVLLDRADDEKINIHSVEKWIKEERDDGFSPEEAMQVLKWSNFYGNIKTAVKEINKCETKEERLAFKEFVLSAVEGRETSGDSLSLLRALAVEGGYEEEFDKANNQRKIYGKHDCGFKSVVVSDRFSVSKDYSNCDFVLFDYQVGDYDLRDIRKWPKNICFTASERLNLSYNNWENCDKLIVSGASKIIFYGTKLPKIVDWGDCKDIDLTGANMRNVENMSFVEGSKIELNSKTNRGFSSTVLSKTLDLRGIDDVDLTGLDFEGCENIIFGKKSKVSLGRSMNSDSGAQNLSGVLDFSEVNEVDLSNCDLSKVTEIKFKKGAKVILDHAIGVPENIDFSELSSVAFFKTDLSKVKKLNFGYDCKVLLKYCDLTNVEELSFDFGVRLHLEGVDNINCDIDFSKVEDFNMTVMEAPKCKIDLSGCRNVDIKGCNLSGGEMCFGEETNVSMWRTRGINDKIDFSKLRELHLRGCTENEAGKFEFPKNASIELEFSTLPEYIDASEVAKLDVKGNFSKIKEFKHPKCGKMALSWSRLGEKVDLSDLDEVDLTLSDFENVKEIKFKDGARVNLKEARNLSGVLDFSNLSYVNLEHADLTKVTEIKFGEGCEVCLKNIEYKPSKIDLSKVEKLDIRGCGFSYKELDLSNVKEISSPDYVFPKTIILSKNNNYLCETLANEQITFKIKKEGEFKFDSDTVVPSRLDLSEFDEVDFGNADLSNLQSCVFKKGASVKLDNVSKYPEILDLSMCGDVSLSTESVAKMNTIVFKNEVQRDKAIANIKFSNILEKMRFKRKCEYCKEVKTQINNNRRNDHVYRNI